MTINIVITILIGLFLNMVWQSIIFMISYIPLRMYAGGYHSRSQTRCFWYSILLILSVLLEIRFIPWTNFIILGLAMISGTIIYLLAPVEDENKPLTESEVRVYKNRTRCILFLELVSIFILITNNMYAEGVCVLLSIFVLSIMLVIGKVFENWVIEAVSECSIHVSRRILLQDNYVIKKGRKICSKNHK